MDRLIKEKSILGKIDAMINEPAYQHAGEDWVNGLIMSQDLIYNEPSVDAIPVSWIMDYLEENFWARCDVLRLVDAWHEYVKNKGGNKE